METFIKFKNKMRKSFKDVALTSIHFSGNEIGFWDIDSEIYYRFLLNEISEIVIGGQNGK